MKTIIFCLMLVLCARMQAQEFRGQVFMKEDANVFLNHIYVTNLNTQHTVMSNYLGEFMIGAKAGDIIRFTSIISQRKDVRITSELLQNERNYIELREAYIEIPEVVIRFKPTGNLKTDVLALKSNEKKLQVAKIVGLPEPKGDGTSPVNPPVSLGGGSINFSVDTIFDLISGEQKKKKRLQEYEKMASSIAAIRSYYGDDYFTRMKIPANLIDDFLQFVYSSDNISPYADIGNFVGIQPYIEKYIPIYMKRLRSSHIMEISK